MLSTRAKSGDCCVILGVGQCHAVRLIIFIRLWGWKVASNRISWLRLCPSLAATGRQHTTHLQCPRHSLEYGRESRSNLFFFTVTDRCSSSDLFTCIATNCLVGELSALARYSARKSNIASKWKLIEYRQLFCPGNKEGKIVVYRAMMPLGQWWLDM